MEDDSTSLAIVRAPDASQKVFRVNADNAIDIRSGTVIIGSAETGALDSVIGEIRLMGGATLNTYVKKIGRRRKIEKYFGRGRLQFQGRRDFRRRGSSLVRGRLFHTGRNYKLRFYRFQSWRRRIRPHKGRRRIFPQRFPGRSFHGLRDNRPRSGMLYAGFCRFRNGFAAQRRPRTRGVCGGSRGGRARACRSEGEAPLTESFVFSGKSRKRKSPAGSPRGVFLFARAVFGAPPKKSV